MTAKTEHAPGARVPGKHDPGVSPTAWLVLSPRRVWRIGLALIAAQAVLRLLMGLGTYFVQDDYVFYTLGSSEPFDLSYLFQDRGNHLMPAGQAIAWGLARYLPLAHGPAVVAMVFIQVLASLAVFVMLRELFGLRSRVLAPLSFYLFGALTLPAFLWWAASLNALGLQLAMALAITSHARWLRSRRWYLVATTLLATLLGLLFFEKAVLFLPLLIGLTWVAQREGSAGRDLVRVLKRHWYLWVLMSLEVLAWTALYLHQVNTGYAERADSGVTSDLVLDSVSRGLVPAIFGGPWTWTDTPSFLGFAPSPPALLVMLSWIGLIAVLIVTVAFRRGMGRLWVVAFAYVATDMALIAWGRAGAFGSGVGLEYRYYADAALVLALLVGYALLPLRGETDPWTTQSQGARAWARTHLDWLRVAGWAVLIIWCVSATWSSLALAQAWRTITARVYIETAKAELAALPEGTKLLDEPVPPSVLLGWFAPLNGTSQVLGPLHQRPEFVDSVTELLTITPEGRVVDGAVDGVRTEPGPDPGCGWAVTSGNETTIPLDRPVFEWNWTAKVSYLAGTDTTGTFTLGKETATVPLQRGLHDVYFALPASGSAIDVTLNTPGAGVCIDRIELGNRVPAEDLEGGALGPPDGQPSAP